MLVLFRQMYCDSSWFLGLMVDFSFRSFAMAHRQKGPSEGRSGQVQIIAHRTFVKRPVY